MGLISWQPHFLWYYRTGYANAGFFSCNRPCAKTISRLNSGRPNDQAPPLCHILAPTATNWKSLKEMIDKLRSKWKNSEGCWTLDKLHLHIRKWGSPCDFKYKSLPNFVKLFSCRIWYLTKRSHLSSGYSLAKCLTMVSSTISSIEWAKPSLQDWKSNQKNTIYFF